MKFNFLLTIFGLLLAFNVSAQTLPLSEEITFTPECNPSEVIVSTDNFSYSIHVDGEISDFLQANDFKRDIYIYYTVDGGPKQLLRIVAGGPFYGGAFDFELTQADFDAMPEGLIRFSLEFQYFHTSNNQFSNPFSVFVNGSLAGFKNFTNPSQAPIIVALDDVKCFTKYECDDVTISFHIKNGYLHANVQPGDGHYSFNWRVERPNEGQINTNGPSIQILKDPGCLDYSIIVTDLESGCVYANTRTVCNFETPGGSIGLGGFHGDQDDDNDKSLEYSESAQIAAFPNPTSSVLNIYAKNLQSSIVEIVITDMEGKLVFETKRTVENGAIDYTWNPQLDIANGVYIVSIKDNKTVENRPFVISR